MRIGYITKEDPNDVRAYSGTHYAMFQALKGEFEEVVPLGPINHWYKNVAKLKGKIKTFRSNKVFKFQYDLKLAKIHADIIDRRIRKEKPDILLGSLVSPEVAYLTSDVPLYLTTDATFPRLGMLHSSHKTLYKESFENALLLEKKAFSKAEKIVLPLDWLKESAIKDYGITENKIEVIPYGKNFEISFGQSEIDNLIKLRKNKQELKFLFVGINWEQKGGYEALSIVRELTKKGLKSRLVVVGCIPEFQDKLMDVFGFLRKDKAEDLNKLTELYKSASFFLLPTKAECVGMSFIEAASFGLPAIGTNVGGVPEAVIDGETGIIIQRNDTSDMIAEKIFQIWKSDSEYERLSSNAFSRYSEQMNWKNWANRVKEVLSKEVI